MAAADETAGFADGEHGLLTCPVCWLRFDLGDIMHLANPHSAVLAAVIFNALIIIALIPLALRGVAYKPMGAGAVLRRNLLLYGIGGIIAPFPGIWIIDRLLVLLKLA